MINKKFIHDVVTFQNSLLHGKKDISYGFTNYGNYLYTSCVIWKNDKIIDSFYSTIHNNEELESFKEKLKMFIEVKYNYGSKN